MANAKAQPAAPPKGQPQQEETKQEENEPTKESPPQMTVAVLVTWVLPVLLIALFSRFGVDVDALTAPIKVDSRPINIDTSRTGGAQMEGMMMMMKTPSDTPPSASPHPTSYQETLNTIKGRKRKWTRKPKPGPRGSSSPAPLASPTPPIAASSSSSASASASAPSSDGAVRSNDPFRQQLDETIEQRRQLYKRDPANIMNAIYLADALRHKDLKYHDGGLGQVEALDAYNHAIQLTIEKREKKMKAGEPTNLSLSGTTNIQEELMFDYAQKSVDGLLCSLYTAQGKLFFMANMFERAVEVYSKCIEIEPLYLDAVGSRGSSLIILGKYEEAGKDFSVVIHNDSDRLFNDAFTGMSKVLAVKEDGVPEGWDPMVKIVEEMIGKYTVQHAVAGTDDATKQYLAEALNRIHHVMFTYHDSKTKDRDQAWHHLTSGYKFKMGAVDPFSHAMEKQKLETTKAVFHHDFWPAGIGSPSKVPIFIIGFVRSGSTLLERVLDAHPAIVGTGEDSVFNGRLDQIRNAIVKASMSGDPTDMHTVVRENADSVVEDMRKRYSIIDANTEKDTTFKSEEPSQMVDKMLTNYNNVGFIHMCFPNALILHVARNPMDVIWSAFKHEFPPGGLDYTSEFASLASMYNSYREIIQHWDSVLPGRITHVRYEDLVNDMPGMAKSIIAATGLAWDDAVLEFHKKKQAVNTLSTTQVRKGIYKHSMEAWKKYESQLQPLVKTVGGQVRWDLKTTLPNYVPPAPEATASS